MEVRCDKCQARYKVDDARIGPQGLTMRCGKCQNVFKVTKAAPQQASPPPPPPDRSTMMFAAPNLQKAAAPPKPPEPGEEGAGRTMMFQSGNIKVPPAAPAAKPVAKPQSTMLFGQSVAAARKAEGAGSTMMFAAAAPAAAKAKSATAITLPEVPVPRIDGNAPTSEPQGDEAAPDDEKGALAEGADEQELRKRPGAFDKAPPKGLLIGVGAGIAALIVAAAAVVAVKKFGRHAPSQAAVETLASASAAADKDSLAALAEAEGRAKDALDVAGPRSYFPQATATLASIEVQWADALNDQAALWIDRGAKAAERGNETKKAEAETKAADFASQAKARLRSAFDIVDPALKKDPKSPDLELAKADYFRALRSSSNMNRELRKAVALKAEPARIALLQGLLAAQEEDGAEKALPKLKEALASNPQSARIHFRMALAYLQLKDDKGALKELKETLKISPQHERARQLLESLAAPSAAEQK